MYNQLILPDLQMMLRENDAQGLREFCEALYPVVSAEILEGLEAKQIWQVLSNCDVERQGEIFGFISLPRQVELIDAIDRKRLAKLIEEMAPDDRVDLLSRLEKDRIENLLPLVAQAERSDIRKLLSYPEDSAGSIMTTEYASLPADITVGEALLEHLRKQAPDSETIYYVYIIDEGRRLQGFVSLRELVLAPRETAVSEIMTKDVISVRVEDDQEIVAQELAKFDFLAIPVVDRQNQLVGIVTHDDAMDVVQQEATEDAHLMGAVYPLEDSYLQTPLKTLFWKRGIWLMLLAGVALVNADVLKHYPTAAKNYVWMILFLPLVLASGGNAGSQSATLIIRAMALRNMSRKENIGMIVKEIQVGLFLGLCLAGIGFVAAVYWFHRTSLESSVVASTVLIVVILGTLYGALLPLTLRKFGMDPAIMSNPLIASIMDISGVVIYFNVALWILGVLVKDS